ncbi:hypothetical protein QGM61_06220 [Pseudohongiella sp. SYSU M77423]|uniref:hypothetical protein n=1 Tax=unclassified Pseudohongiella TaxID=2629611 RepID=UPI001F423A01|nr:MULTISPECIES: hypothetical protein [unclassified Pseudohongiella]MDH7943409.1 hypothetical protein [Pseudohongiella sp. SYSU M77423]
MTVLAWIFIIFAGFATLVSLSQVVMVSIIFSSEELQIASLLLQANSLSDLIVAPEGGGFEGVEQFGTILLWFSVALGIAIRNEFVQFTSEDMSGPQAAIQS